MQSISSRRILQTLSLIILHFVFWVGILLAIVSLVPLFFLLGVLLFPDQFLGFGVDVAVATWLVGPWLLTTAAIGWFKLFKGRFRFLWIVIGFLGLVYTAPFALAVLATMSSGG